MLDLRDVVNIAASGTMGCVQQGNDSAIHSLVERAVAVASVGLTSALDVSEALVDRVLPPDQEEKGILSP